MRGELVAGVANRATNAIAALADAGIRETDHREAWQTERDVNLDRDRGRFNAENRRGPQACQHAGRPCKQARRSRPMNSLGKPKADRRVDQQPSRYFCAYFKTGTQFLPTVVGRQATGNPKLQTKL